MDNFARHEYDGKIDDKVKLYEYRSKNKIYWYLKWLCIL